jgi:hypothetical protein
MSKIFSDLVSVWKEKPVWLFFALSLASGLSNIPPIQKNAWWLWGIPTLLGMIFYLIGSIGVTYIAYCVFIGKPVIFLEIFQVIRKSFRRVIAVFLGAVVLFIPCVCSIPFSLKQPLQPSYISQHLSLVLWPYYLFIAILYFSVAEIVINDSGIRKSVKNAWYLFISHLRDVALMGIIAMAIGQLANILIGMVAVLTQSNFELKALSTIDYINPALSMSDNIFYHSATTVSSAVLSICITTIFVFAYLKYVGMMATPKPLPK